MIFMNKRNSWQFFKSIFGDVEAVKSFLAGGGDPNVRTGYHKISYCGNTGGSPVTDTVLICAIEAESLEVVRLLLHHGADISLKARLSGSGISAVTKGGCSRITWALVPLIPNDDTAARRGRSRCGQGCCSVNSDTAPADQSTCGVGTSTCKVRGSNACCMAMVIFMTPATPAAADV